MGQQPKSFIPDPPPSFVPDVTPEEQKKHDAKVKAEQATYSPAWKFGETIFNTLSGISEGVLGLEPNAERGDIGDYVNLGMQGAGVLGAGYGLFRGGRALLNKRVPGSALPTPSTGAIKSAELPSASTQRRLGEVDYDPVLRPGQNYGHFRRMGEKDYTVPNNAAAQDLEKERTRIFMEETLRKQGYNPDAFKNVRMKPKNPVPNAANPAPSSNPTLYHGTRSNVTSLEGGRGSGFGNFNKWVHFAEDPEYSSLYSLGEYGSMKRNIPSSEGANTIAAKVGATNVLDLTKPPTPDDLQILGMVYKGDLSKATPEFITDLVKQNYEKLPYDAIKFSEHGKTNWAVNPSVKMDTPQGVPLNQGTQKFAQSVDPNFNAGQGDPMLAGSTPYSGGGNQPPTIPPTGGGNLPIPPNPNPNIPQIPVKKTFTEIAKEMTWRDWVGLPRALITTPDLGPAFRQGIGMAGRKEWFNAWDDMVRAAGSENAALNVQREIAVRPNFKARVKTDAAGKPIINTKTGLPDLKESLAEEAGLQISDFNSLGKQEEQFISSQLIESIPGYGRLVRGSNRAYATFLNKVRADVFDNLVTNYKNIGVDLSTDLPKLKQVANFVNAATGRGSLGKLEKYAEDLNTGLFSPRLIASRLHMMNPRNYFQKDPILRKEYWKSFFSIIGTGATTLGLAKAAGADIGLDPYSADFGKARFGKTRLDPWGGFQQYGVLFSRFMGNQITTGSGNTRPLGTQTTPTRAGLFLNFEDTQNRGRGFLGNKVTPTVGLAWDWLSSMANKPFDVPEAMKNTLVPIIAQDMMEIIQEDPSLLWMLGPSATGMGTQTYGK